MKKIVLSLLLCAAALSGRAEHGYSAHEWGTFTSVQGGDGQLQVWRPLQTWELPGFVHSGALGPKGPQFGPMTQRMETPVIYFHSARAMAVDVSVRFPQGLITEFYPQAAVSPHGIEWKNLAVLTGSQTGLKQDGAGLNYFAARQAGGNLLDSPGTNRAASEFEKFLFYRGVGNFKTPLRASVGADNAIVVENTGARQLSRLFLVSIHDGRGSFAEMKGLAGNSSRPKSFASRSKADLPLKEFQRKIAARVESALTAEGLFPDEARAMVDTWKNSWFAEEGERVLYLLPRGWTDEILPLTISPPPEKLVRVMVGRAEILTPNLVANLREIVLKAGDGDTVARAQAVAQLRKLGRFAQPALQLTNLPATPDSEPGLGTKLLLEAARF